MLQRLDKLSPIAVMLVLGYLTYSGTQDRTPRAAVGKPPPQLTKRMLSPRLIEPEPHASPTDRDPFEVAWSSYLGSAPASASQPAPAPATRPAPASAPIEVSPPPVPGRLVGVFVGEGIRLAVIGERVYKEGAPVGGDDPETCWRIESIDKNGAVLRFGRFQKVLRMPAGEKSGARPGRGRKELPQ